MYLPPRAFAKITFLKHLRHPPYPKATLLDTISSWGCGKEDANPSTYSFLFWVKPHPRFFNIVHCKLIAKGKPLPC